MFVNGLDTKEEGESEYVPERDAMVGALTASEPPRFSGQCDVLKEESRLIRQSFGDFRFGP